MAVTIVGSDVFTGTNPESWTHTLPGGYVAGDVGWVFVTSDQAVVTLSADTAGWVELVQTSETDGRDRTIAVYRKVLGGSESNPQFSEAGDNEETVSFLVVLRGVDNTTPEDISLVVEFGTNEFTTAHAAFTPVTDNAAAFLFHAIYDAEAPATLVVPSGWSEEDQDLTFSFGASILAYDLDLGTAGLVTPGAWQHTFATDGNKDVTRVTLVVRPAADGGATADAAPAAGTGTAPPASTTIEPTAGPATSTGSATPATVASGTSAPTGTAASSGAANGTTATIQPAPTPGTSAGTGSPAVAAISPHASAAGADGSAPAASVAMAPAASPADGAGTALGLSATIQPVATPATAPGTASRATISTSAQVQAPAGATAGAGTAPPSAVTIEPTAGPAPAVVSAGSASAVVSPGAVPAVGVGSAPAASSLAAITALPGPGAGAGTAPVVAPIVIAGARTAACAGVAVTPSVSGDPAGEGPAGFISRARPVAGLRSAVTEEVRFG